MLCFFLCYCLKIPKFGRSPEIWELATALVTTVTTVTIVTIVLLSLQCEFVAKNSNGLKIHTRNKHTISQRWKQWWFWNWRNHGERFNITQHCDNCGKVVNSYWHRKHHDNYKVSKRDNIALTHKIPKCDWLVLLMELIDFFTIWFMIFF